MSKPASNNQLNVIARAPFHKYFEGQASSVSGTNRVGNFDILPGHADFFSVMVPGNVVIETEAQTITFPITSGIITVRGSDVMLFVNM